MAVIGGYFRTIDPPPAGGTTITKGNVVGTSRGKPVTEADIERTLAEAGAEAGYDIAKL